MDEKQAIRDKIIKGLGVAYARMVQLKRTQNNPLVVMRNGSVVELNPFEAETEIIYQR